MPNPKKRSRTPRAGVKNAARKVVRSRASTDRGRGRAAKNSRTGRAPAKRAAPPPGRASPPGSKLPPLPRPLEQELRQTASRGREEEARNNLRKALAAFDGGKLGSSLAAALKAKDAAPRSPSVREVLGLVLHARGDHKGALGELRAFRRMSGSPLQDPTIADCLRTLGKPDEALEILGALRKDDLDPSGWADAQIARALAHSDRGNIDAAIGVLRAADEDWPPNPVDHHLRVRYALADLIEKAGNREDARRLFARVAVHSPSFRDALDRAR